MGIGVTKTVDLRSGCGGDETANAVIGLHGLYISFHGPYETDWWARYSG